MAEIVACPACKRKLQIPDEYFGKTVQCPECKQTFTANPGSTSVQSTSPPPLPPTPPTPRPPSSVPEWEKPTRRASRRDEEDDDDLDDRRPRRRSRRRADRDEDDFDDRPSRRRYYEPHRGGLLLTLGLLSVCCGLVLGPVTWVLANSDLAKMRDGSMDPAGEGLTQAGRVLAIIFTIFGVISALGLAINRH